MPKSDSGAPDHTAKQLKELHQREAASAGFLPAEWRGIFLMQGQRLALSSFTINIDDHGELTSEGPQLSTGVEMAPYWLSIAIDHAVKAFELADLTNEAWRAEDPQSQSAALEAKFKASLQAMTSAAFAVDAFYATIQEEAPAPEATRAAWRKNGTARSRQVFETFRRNFPLTQASQAALKVFLDRLFSFRDTAVHPTARTRDAVKHPRLPVSTDLVFCIFRAQNACVCVGQVADLLTSFASHPKIRLDKLRLRLEPIKTLLEPPMATWRASRAAKWHFEERRRADDEAAGH